MSGRVPEMGLGLGKVRPDLHYPGGRTGMRRQKLPRAVSIALLHAFPHADSGLGIIPGLRGEREPDAIRLGLMGTTIGKDRAVLSAEAERRVNGGQIRFKLGRDSP